ncbi:MAG TPA: hypothetical protein VLK33_08695 [Terriglobales bacterium]|nr:hypothetical protein [Terriglobales bacterium]
MSPIRWTESHPLALHPFKANYGFFYSRPRARMDGLTSKISFNRMLGRSTFTDYLPHSKTPCFGDG